MLTLNTFSKRKHVGILPDLSYQKNFIKVSPKYVHTSRGISLRVLRVSR